jgi:hypothetical protein
MAGDREVFFRKFSAYVQSATPGRFIAPQPAQINPSCSICYADSRKALNAPPGAAVAAGS